MRNGVLCVGTVAVDYTKTIEALPELESLVLIDAVTQSTGGPGLNIAFDLRQLDPALTVEAIGCIANDPAGDYILEQTNSAGIVNSRMQRAITQQTSFSDALTLTSNGKRTFLFHSGSNDELDLGLIDADLNHPKILDFTSTRTNPISGLSYLNEHRRLAFIQTWKWCISLLCAQGNWCSRACLTSHHL